MKIFQPTKKPKPTKKPAKKTNEILSGKEILSLIEFISEHPADDQFDEYPTKIFTSNKGAFACLMVTIKRNIKNTNLIPNDQICVKTLRTNIRSIVESIINFAFQTNTHNCSSVSHFSYYNTDMHVSININYPWVLTCAVIKNTIMKLRTPSFIDRVISACKNNI